MHDHFRFMEQNSSKSDPVYIYYRGFVVYTYYMTRYNIPNQVFIGSALIWDWDFNDQKKNIFIKEINLIKNKHKKAWFYLQSLNSSDEIAFIRDYLDKNARLIKSRQVKESENSWGVEVCLYEFY